MKMLIRISIPIRIFIDDDLDSSMAVDQFLISKYNTKMLRTYGKFQ